MPGEKIEDIYIHEFHSDLIPPTAETMNNPKQGGAKITVIGKPGCFAKGTKVLKFDGSIANVEDIKKGDLLMGDDSTPRKVLELCRGKEKMYKIKPMKGDPIIVNENHILSLKCTGYNQHKKGEILNITVKDFLNKSKTLQMRYKWYRTGVNFEAEEVELDPYLLGYWLGDGNSNEPMITTTDEEVLVYFDQKLAELGLYLKQKPQDPISYRIIQTDGPKHFANHFRNYLRDNNLFGNKHIPTCYKINSKEIRLALLAGILDADGYYDKRGKGYDIIQKSEKLIDDVIFLARSLGFAAYKTECLKRCTNSPDHIGIYYRCFIAGAVHEIPCEISRKKAEVRKGHKDVLVSGFELQALDEDNYYGFTLDGNHLFLLEDFSVVHNTGKTTLIDRLLYEKKHIFPVGWAMSGTEDSNAHFESFMEPLFVYNKLQIERINTSIRRQRLAINYTKCPWAVWITDDVCDDTKIFNKPLYQGLYKNGRHWKMMYILSVQYIMDQKVYMRSNTDGVFIGRENSSENRRKLWKNFAGCVPTFDLFNQLMDTFTSDFEFLFIRNNYPSNKLEDLVFYWKPPPCPNGWKFGCREYHEFAQARYNNEYMPPLY